ncbi:FAD-dependent monooxygenase [Nocardia sp. BMG51109]|uniref:FAD-dependent monooxygenase n=1 Tax=Nocardia sp. BMG51109 TaxID=1056816 RepID=UPI0004657BB3|nr:FAD-dependent monooxygenase [Nocardia sp. BMG51109]
MKRTPRVAIIGGGIGGATLAAALDHCGIDYRLFERTHRFGEVGAGVQLTPNAVTVLDELGFADELRRVAFVPEAMVGRNWKSGRELFRTPLRDSCETLYGAPFLHIHRADLHALLTERIPDDRVRLGTACAGIRHDADTAVASFDDGSEFEADLVVGCDGIRSTVRAALLGDQDATYTGHMCWRALVPVDKYPLPHVRPESAFWMGPNSHIVTYYVKGGAMVNVVAVKEHPGWVEESWTIPSTKAELLHAYTGWSDDIQALLGGAEDDQIFKWGLFDRDPMSRWSADTVTLLGDAAHPMLPFLSQGAAISIEDAYVLARTLAHHDADIPLALKKYEAERIPRASRVQLAARERGRTYHLPTRWAQFKRDARYRLRQLRSRNTVGIQADWVYDYNAVERMNQLV